MFTTDHLFGFVVLFSLVWKAIWEFTERRESVFERIVWISARVENNDIFLHILDDGGNDHNGYANPEQERHFRIP